MKVYVMPENSCPSCFVPPVAFHFSCACARAILFSDRDTCAKLSAFSSQLITFRADPASFSPDAFNDAAYDAFESMRQELLQMHHPLVKHKHRR